MADISLIDPYSAQQESIARQRRMAQALQQQAQTPMETPQTPGVLLSPYAGLAKVLQGVYGGYQEAQADKEYKALVEEARQNQTKDLAAAFSALNTPAIPGVEGKAEVPYEPAQIQQIYGTKPAPITGRGYGFGMQMPDQVIGEKIIKPEVKFQAGVTAVPGVPAGFISPALLENIKDPTTRNLLLARALKQAEPQQVTLGENQRLLERTGGGAFKELVGPVTAADKSKIGNVNPSDYTPESLAKFSTTQKYSDLVLKPTKTEATALSPLGKLQSERAAIAAKNPTDPSLKTYDDAIANEARNVAAERLAWDQKVQEAKDKAPNYTYKEEVDPTTGVKSLIKIDNKGVVSEVLNSAGTKVKTEVLKTPAHYSEIEDKGNIVIVDMNLPADQRLAKGQIKGPIRGNLKQIETNDAEGRPVTRWVDESTLAALGDIPKQYTGLLLEMAQAGQLKKGWESDPRVAGVVRDNLINQSGGITPAKLAELRVRIAESAAKLAYEGVSGFSVKDLTPSLSNLTTLPSGSSAPAPAAASKITTRAEIAETAKRSGKSIEEVTRDAVQKGFRVQ